ncbi:hypothetical protein OAG75_00540 [bacterium]|nr:hypothetical protein [bacterium]
MKFISKCFLLVLISPSILFSQVETFDLPRLDGITIDGDFSDWTRMGFGVEVLMQEEGALKSADDHNVHFRAGWNNQGLLIYLTVQDNDWIEYPEKGKYYSADVVEVFLAGQRGDEDVCQWYITPGMTQDVTETGVRFRELRRGSTKGLPSQLLVEREKLGPNLYRMEILVPWSSIGKTGQSAMKAAFQIWVNDKDAGSRRKRYMSIFYPAKGASYASNAMHNIQLVEHSNPSLRITALGEYDMSRFQPFVRLWATSERQGMSVSVRQGEVVLGTSTLSNSEAPGRTTAKLFIPPAPIGQPYNKIGIYLGEQKVNSISLPYSDVMENLEQVYQKREQYRKLFKLDEPWSDIVGNPLLKRHRGLAAAGLNLLEQSPPPSTARDLEILSTTVAMLAALENGEDYFSKQKNGLWGYYFCKADGTGQRFSLTVPKNFDPDRTYPLYVNLHGNGGRPLPTKSEARQTDYFQIRPWGRGDISYFGLGEVDVLESIRHMLKWYPIDRNRICLGGHSMGGNGTWDLASKHSNLFACLTPKAGRSSDDYYENFRHLPALIQHGAKDSSQPVEFGRYTANRLEELGFSVIYKEFSEDGHGIRNPYPVEEWFVNQRRPNHPEVITYTCDSVKTGEAYWAKILRFVDPHRKASVEARVTQTAPQQTVELELTNIEVIQFNLDDAPIDKSKPSSILVDNQELKLTAPHSRNVVLVLQRGTWKIVDSWVPPSTGKRPYHPGATANLYSGEPLLIVYPTEGDEGTRQIMEEAARRIVLFGGSGPDMITGRIPIKADHEVTMTDIEHRNLILFGGPDYNVISRQLATQLPVKVNAKQQFLVPGHTPMDVASSSLLLTTFNPIAPQRLIHLIWEDKIPSENREKFLIRVRNKLPGANGRYPHNIPDVQINSRDRPTAIRRQFTYNWKLKETPNDNKQQIPKVAQEGIGGTKLRMLQSKTGVDFAIGLGMGTWGTQTERPTLDQFRYRNYTTTTFKAKIRGSDLVEFLNTSKYLQSFPPVLAADIAPKRVYQIAVPEGVIWAAKEIRKYWTNVEAGPDIQKADIIKEVYGVVE